MEHERFDFLREVVTSPELFDRWVMRHPRRLASALGWCAAGQEVTEDMAAAIAAALAGRPSQALLDEIAALFGGRAQEDDMPERPDDLVTQLLKEKRAREGRAAEEVPAAAPPPPPPPPRRTPVILRDEAPRRGGADGPGGGGNASNPTTPEDVIKFLLDLGTAAAGAAGGPLLGNVLSRIDWAKVIQVLEEGARAKKERDVYRALAITWEHVGAGKDFLINLLREPDKLDPDTIDKVLEFFTGAKPSGSFSKERKEQICNELLPKLTQIQAVLGQARRHADDGRKDDAKKDLDNLAHLLQALQDYFKNLKP